MHSHDTLEEDSDRLHDFVDRDARMSRESRVFAELLKTRKLLKNRHVQKIGKRRNCA